jgi:hypothetical protein
MDWTLKLDPAAINPSFLKRIFNHDQNKFIKKGLPLGSH